MSIKLNFIFKTLLKCFDSYILKHCRNYCMPIGIMYNQLFTDTGPAMGVNTKVLQPEGGISIFWVIDGGKDIRRAYG